MKKGNAILVVGLTLLLAACTTQKKATRYFNEHKAVAANYCAETFPITESFKVVYSEVHDTLRIPGPVRDSLIQCDSTVKGKPVKQVRFECPPTTVIRDEYHRDSFAIQESAAKAKAMELAMQAQKEACDKQVSNLQAKILAQGARIDTLQDSNKAKAWWIFWLIAGITVYFIIRYWRPIKAIVLHLVTGL